MSAALDPRSVRALLLDVEGTTTPVAFVYEVLFPFARAGVERFLERQGNDASVQSDLESLRDDRDREADPACERGSAWNLAAAAQYVRFMIDRDRKSTALKSLQGKIWQDGYERGELRGEVYPDVPRAFARWRAQGRDIAIFSSGSVLAQRLLFAHSTAGDLAGFLRAYFDTSTGPKKEAESYSRIARSLEIAPESLVFVSDTLAELDAAREARMNTLVCIRPGSAATEPSSHARIASFDEVLPDPAPTR